MYTDIRSQTIMYYSKNDQFFLFDFVGDYRYCYSSLNEISESENYN
jgi:hypothetical protein